MYFRASIFLLLISSLGGQIHAETLDPIKSTPKNWIACKNIEKNGLFEQCEAVKIIKTYDDRVRVYSLAKKSLINVHRSQVFILTKVQDEEVAENQILAVPGSILSNASSIQYQSLCRSVGWSKDELKMDCGRPTPQRADPKLVYKAVSSEEFLPSSTSPTLRTKLEPRTKG